MGFNRVVIDGTLLSGAERFSCGLAFQGAGGEFVQGSPQLSTWANAIMSQVTGTAGSWGPTLRSQIGASGTVAKVRCYSYTTIGQPATGVGESTGAPIAGSGTVTCPPQCSICFSLVTGIPGRRTRGRFYWPGLTATFSGAGKITGPTTPANLALAGAQMLDEIGDVSGAASPLSPVVVSEAGNLITTVNAVAVGDVMDTQRRRRDGLVEVKSVSNVPTP